MINSIQNGDHRLLVVAQVSLAGTALNAIPTLKDPKSLLIQGLSNEIYSLIDSNETAKDLWDALERQMRGFEYGEQDRKAAILYEYETFKATEGEQFLDTYLRYLQGINDLKKCKDNLSKQKEKVKVQTESEGSDVDDISDLKKITALLAKAFNRKKYYAKPTNNNLRTSSASSSVNKKPDDEQVLFAEDQAWMESSSDSDQEINANMVFMAKMESEIFIENHIDSQKEYDKFEVDHNDSEENDHLVDKLIRKFNHKIAKCHKHIEKSNQQTKYIEIQNKDLQEKYDVLINQVNTFEEQNNEFNEQMKMLNEKNVDLLDQIEVLQDQLKVKHVVIDTHAECQAQYTKIKEERYEYMIRYFALYDNDKQHRKKIDKHEILFDKMSHQLVKMNNNVLRLCDSFNENNLFVFNDVCVRNSQVSKMPFRKKPHDSLNIVQICLWIIDSGYSKHMTGNRALLTNFVEKFFRMVRFGNNDFAVIAGYGDMVIGSMTIKKV
nr:integrase, catalytic region, zinc finger, CCHC-type, peptidase aspartic, catalytic [Tanacetum cinerariifolium]